MLNDEFRRSLQAGCVVLTQGVRSLLPEARGELLQAVRSFDQFDADNDPYGEHDFGALHHDGERYFWKIDYYDVDLSGASPDPSDAAVTARVLTIMRADEY